MAKFKWTGETNAFLTSGKVYEFKNDGGKYSKFIDDTGGVHSWSTSNMLEDVWVPVDASSPVRTRREIVPGVYGIVSVGLEVHPNKGRPIVCVGRNGRGASSDELREAAHILNQIAEVLEENAG